MDNGAATSDNLINFNSPAPTSNNNNNNRFRNSNNRKTSRPNSPTISTEVSLNEVREEVNNNLQNSKRTSRNSDRLAMINTEERVPIKDRGNPPPDDTVVKIQGVTLDIDDIPSIIDPKDTVDQEIKPASPNITISNANLGTSKSENIIPLMLDPETPNVKVDPAPVNSNRSLKPVPRTPRSYNSLNSPSSPVTGDKNPANTVNTANTPKISVQPPISINTNTRSKVANSRLLKPMISQPTPISTPAPAPAPPPPPANLPEEINLLSEDNNHRVPITNNLNNNNNNLIDSFFDDTTDKDSRNTNPPNPPNLEDKNVKSATATSTPTPPPPPTTPTAPINMPNYAAMTPTEKALQRATFRTRYGILRTAWPNYHIPDISDDKSLEEIHVEYDSYVRHIRISQDVDTYKIYLVIVWLVIELAITKTGLNIGGYTISQMRSMGKYERLLIELGETNYRAGSNSIFTQTTWPGGSSDFSYGSDQRYYFLSN